MSRKPSTEAYGLRTERFKVQPMRQ